VIIQAKDNDPGGMIPDHGEELSELFIFAGQRVEKGPAPNRT
jgi:hypothetical protein